MVRLFALGVLLSLMAPTDALAQKKIPKAQGMISARWVM